MELEMAVVLRQLLLLLKQPVTCPWCYAELSGTYASDEREWASWYIFLHKYDYSLNFMGVACDVGEHFKCLDPVL
jgi:hypothetical protein